MMLLIHQTHDLQILIAFPAAARSKFRCDGNPVIDTARER